jgi:hypothetical protein
MFGRDNQSQTPYFEETLQEDMVVTVHFKNGETLVVESQEGWVDDDGGATCMWLDPPRGSGRYYRIPIDGILYWTEEGGKAGQ